MSCSTVVLLPMPLGAADDDHVLAGELVVFGGHCGELLVCLS